MNQIINVEDLPKDKKIILFDGVCNLCDKSVQLIIKNDKKDNFVLLKLCDKEIKESSQHEIKLYTTRSEV